MRLLLSIAVGFAGCDSEANEAPPNSLPIETSGPDPTSRSYSVVEQPLGPIPENMAEVVESHNGRHVAWIENINTKRRVAIDARNGPEFEDVGDLQFSPDGETAGIHRQTPGTGQLWS